MCNKSRPNDSYCLDVVICTMASTIVHIIKYYFSELSTYIYSCGANTVNLKIFVICTFVESHLIRDDYISLPSNIN